MPLLTELGAEGNAFVYKHVAPNAARAVQLNGFSIAILTIWSTPDPLIEGETPGR